VTTHVQIGVLSVPPVRVCVMVGGGRFAVTSELQITDFFSIPSRNWKMANTIVFVLLLLLLTMLYTAETDAAPTFSNAVSRPNTRSYSHSHLLSNSHSRSHKSHSRRSRSHKSKSHKSKSRRSRSHKSKSHRSRSQTPRNSASQSHDAFAFHADKVSNTLFGVAAAFTVCAFCIFFGALIRHTMKAHGSFGSFFADSYPSPTARKHDISVNMARLPTSDPPPKEGIVTKLERQIKKMRDGKKPPKQEPADVNVEDDDDDYNDQQEENITFNVV
jgi:hypothetical protein